MKALHLTAGDRVLIFAPHPDDETIATGELIQLALGVGAAVRVVFATDGDNNPWPQRWLDRRWHIGAQERARWGQRRRREALAALEALGMAADDARFLGWPDQGLTECLMRDDAATTCLVEEIAAFVPSHVAMPELCDRHPDHSALRVMLDLALLRAQSAATRLGYTVHGHANPHADAVTVDADRVRQQHKQQAMLAHASQVALSRRRLLGLAGRAECFAAAGVAGAAPGIDRASRVRVPHRLALSPGRRHELLLVLATKQETIRHRAMLPRFPWRKSTSVLIDAQGHPLPVEWDAGALNLSLPAVAAPLLAAYAKLDRCAPRLLIFDRERWHDAADLLTVGGPLLGNTATGLV